MQYSSFNSAIWDHVCSNTVVTPWSMLTWVNVFMFLNMSFNMDERCHMYALYLFLFFFLHSGWHNEISLHLCNDKLSLFYLNLGVQILNVFQLWRNPWFVVEVSIWTVIVNRMCVFTVILWTAEEAAGERPSC